MADKLTMGILPEFNDYRKKLMKLFLRIIT